jgi:hypothetical protein
VIKVIACAAALSLISISANATTLPPASTSVTLINVPSGGFATTTTYSLNGSEPGASGSIVLSPSVSVQDAASDSSTVAGESGVSLLTYYFTVVGGVTGTPVPVDIAWNLLTTASTEPDPTSTAFYAFITAGINGVLMSVCTDPTQCTNSSFNGAVSTTVDVGDVASVSYEVIAESNPFFIGNSFASASGSIYVDPSVSGYCIQVSDGVGGGSCGASATPLPAALPLFASGLGALGLLGWRRRRKAAIAA